MKITNNDESLSAICSNWFVLLSYLSQCPHCCHFLDINRLILAINNKNSILISNTSNISANNHVFKQVSIFYAIYFLIFNIHTLYILNLYSGPHPH